MPQKFRTFDQVQQERIYKIYNKELQLPSCLADIPPQSTKDDLKEAVQAVTSSFDTLGGAFSVNFAGKRAPNKARGEQGALVCSLYGKATSVGLGHRSTGTKKCDCKWAFAFENIEHEGKSCWMLTVPTDTCIKAAIAARDKMDSPPDDWYLCCQESHNHSLSKTVAERNLDSSSRFIPPNLLEQAKMMHSTGLAGPAQIYRVLFNQCREADIPVTFTKKDIGNMFALKTQNLTLDSTNLDSYLRERMCKDPRLFYNTTTNSIGQLERVFFVLNDAHQIWSEQEVKSVYFDTKHGTNRYGQKLGCICTTDSNGKTQILAASFVQEEDHESFSWVFQQFEHAIGRPHIIFTDEDKQMNSALKQEWPDTIHLLCIWHIWKNFYKHIHPLFTGGDGAEHWKTVACMWWDLTKNSDIVVRNNFDTLFNNLMRYIDLHSSGFQPKHRNWLEHKLETKEQWAACYTWRHRTYGVHSTQRAEAIHSAINQFCFKFARIMTITQQLESLSADQHLKTEMDRLESEFKSLIIRETNSPLVGALCRKLTPFAKRILLAQAALMLSYSAHLILSLPRQEKKGLCPHTIKYVETQLSEIPLDDSKLARRRELQAEYGMNIDRTKHVTTLKACSCQFPLVWCLPCRHILCLAIQLNVTTEEEFLVSLILVVIVCHSMFFYSITNIVTFGLTNVNYL